MQYDLEWPVSLRITERKLLNEIKKSERELHPKLSSTLAAIILKRIALLNEVLNMINSNPNTTTEELCSLIDQKLETEERLLKNANNACESEKILMNLKMLGWMKYLITGQLT